MWDDNGDMTAGTVIEALSDPIRRQVVTLLSGGPRRAGEIAAEIGMSAPAAGKRFVICDAGMNTLIRPSLYGAFHFVWPAEPGEGMVPARRKAEAELPGLWRAMWWGRSASRGIFWRRSG